MQCIVRFSQPEIPHENNRRMEIFHPAVLLSAIPIST